MPDCVTVGSKPVFVQSRMCKTFLIVKILMSLFLHFHFHFPLFLPCGFFIFSLQPVCQRLFRQTFLSAQLKILHISRNAFSFNLVEFLLDALLKDL